jgi:Zn-dependent protease with chaperone function
MTQAPMTFAALWLAAAAVLAFSVSLISGVALRLTRERILLLTPAARARLLLSVAALPAFVAVVVMFAVMAPTIGVIADHCHPGGDPHAHPHLCVDHHVAVLPALPLCALALLLVGRTLAFCARGALGLLRAASARRSLSRMATAQGELLVLPVTQAQSFVIGAYRPLLFVTRGLLGDPHLPAVLAHEHAHIQRRDPLFRWLAGILLALHLPGVAKMIATELAEAQEMAADEDAARAIGSREGVARALLYIASQRSAPAGALAFASGDLDRRVRQLLDERPRREWPPRGIVVAAATGVLIVTTVLAGPVHHGVELALGALGG